MTRLHLRLLAPAASVHLGDDIFDAAAGVASDHALRVAEAYRLAARHRCRPVPSVEALVLTLNGTDQVVVAVNVDPLPDQPVAAQFYRKDSNGKAVPEDAWRFPIRVGSHTDFIDPARLPMYINPHIRRMVIHLHRAHAANPVVLIWRRPSNQSTETPVESWCAIKDVDLSANAVKLNVTVTPLDPESGAPLPTGAVDLLMQRPMIHRTGWSAVESGIIIRGEIVAGRWAQYRARLDIAKRRLRVDIGTSLA